MSQAQLGFFDTSCIQWAERGYPTDYLLWFAFEHSAAVTDESIVAHLQQRIEASPVLNRRLCFTPRNLDYPYWVYGIDEVGPLISVSSEFGLGWDECRSRLAEMVATPIDLTVAPLRVQIFRGVSGAPGAEKADVVAVMMSHALMSGRSTGPFAEYMFSTSPMRWRIDGLPAAAVYFQPWRATVRSARVISQMTTSVVKVLRQKRSKDTAPPVRAAKSQWWGADHWGEGPRQEIEIVEIPIPQRGRYSVTEMWVAAIAAALDRFHTDADKSVIVPVSVPVMVPYADAMGANNVLLAEVEVDGTGDDITGRVQKIRDDLRARRSELDSPATARLTAFAANMPHLAQRASVKRTPRHPRADIFVSSMVFSPERDLALAGEPWASGGPINSPAMAALSHVIWTFNDVMNVQITAKPRVEGAVARYLEILREEFDRVVAAAGN